MRTNRQRGELIDGVAARAAVRKLFLIKPLGHARLRFAGVRADHRSAIELAAIDATTAADGRDGWKADLGGLLRTQS
jgi:hypothetical protein